MGGGQTEQPVRSEEAVRPGEAGAGIASHSMTPLAAAEQTAQTHPKPAVEVFVDRATGTVLEIREPATKRAVHVRDRPAQ